MRRLWVLVFLFAWFGLASAQGIRTVRGLAPGDVDGPASSIDSELALFDATTGKLLKGGSEVFAPSAATLVIGDGTGNNKILRFDNDDAINWEIQRRNEDSLQFMRNLSTHFKVLEREVRIGHDNNSGNPRLSFIELDGASNYLEWDGTTQQLRPEGSTTRYWDLDDDELREDKLTANVNVVTPRVETSSGDLTLTPATNQVVIGDGTANPDLDFNNTSGTGTLRSLPSVLTFLPDGVTGSFNVRTTTVDTPQTMFVGGSLQVDRSGNGSEAFIAFGGPEGDASTHFGAVSGELESFELKLPDSVLGVQSVRGMKWTTWDNSGTTQGQCASDRVQADQVFSLTDGVTAPATESGTAFIYVDSADGDLKVKFGDGFVAVIASDS